MPWDISDKHGFKHDLTIILFFFVGSIIWTCYLVGEMAFKVNKVKGWVKTECTIDSVWTDWDHWAENPSFYWIIEYSYQYSGKEYKSDRYNIIEEYRIITKEEKERIRKEKYRSGFMQEPVGPYKPGEKTICYVNPNDPNMAVINREYTYTTFINNHLMIAVVVFIGSTAMLLKFIRTFHC